MRAMHLVPAGVVLAALAAIGGIAQLGHPAAPAPDPASALPRQAAVTSAARACPPAPDGGSAPVALLAGTVLAGTAGTAPTLAKGQRAQVELTALPPAGVAVRATGPVRAQSPGVFSLLTLPAGATAGAKSGPVAQGWSVSASGTMAQAMEAEVAQTSGLASMRCGEPGSDLWFLGPGQANGGTRVQLDLMNVDSLAASVDVSVISDAGQSQAGNDNGITVPPHQTVTQSLSAAAHGSSVLAVEVHTSIGRVAAAVSAGPSHGTPSWLPGTAAPSTRLVIPGVPPSGSTVGLFLADPGTSTAKVTVTAITPQGHIRPFGSQSVDLPGQSASYTALTALGGTTAALQITSDVPVVAGVLVPGSGAGALTAATAPISEQAVVAGNTSGGGLAASVVLTAPAAAARVRLTETAPASRGTGNGPSSVTDSQVVSVKAGRTLVQPVKAPRGARHGSAFALVITPLSGSGPVYAARVETQGRSTVVSIIPAVSALATISLRPVRDSYDAVAPPGGLRGWFPRGRGGLQRAVQGEWVPPDEKGRPQGRALAGGSRGVVPPGRHCQPRSP